MFCRIQQVNKIINRRCLDVSNLSQRLSTTHGEEWPIIPQKALDVKTDDEQDDIKLEVKVKEEKSDELCIDERPRPVKKATKRKSNRYKQSVNKWRSSYSVCFHIRSERDPNAPKRPSNPFFQFCQEQRQIMMEQLNAELKPGEAEPTKQELTRQLAIKWKSLSTPDKKVSAGKPKQV